MNKSLYCEIGEPSPNYRGDRCIHLHGNKLEQSMNTPYSPVTN